MTQIFCMHLFFGGNLFAMLVFLRDDAGESWVSLFKNHTLFLTFLAIVIEFRAHKLLIKSQVNDPHHRNGFISTSNIPGSSLIKLVINNNCRNLPILLSQSNSMIILLRLSHFPSLDVYSRRQSAD